MSMDITKDIRFDRYGDISFEYGDVDVIYGKSDILYQNILSRLISNRGDYPMSDDSFSADLSSLIGLMVSPQLEASVVNKITRALTSDGLIDKSELDIITLQDIDSILIRIVVTPGGITTPVLESFRINSIFNTTSGLLHVTD